MCCSAAVRMAERLALCDFWSTSLRLTHATAPVPQIAVLVVPFCVVLGWCMGQPLDLNLNAFEALVLFASVLLAIIMLQDGHANWLKGAMLIMTYIFVAAGFWAHNDKDLSIVDYDDLNR